MINKFLLGMITSAAITTKEGQALTKQAIKIGNNVLKKYYKIDVEKMLKEIAEDEDKSNNGKEIENNE